MVRFTLRQLSYFVAAARAGSISAAAENEHVSATAIASSITQLERILGTPLAIRRKAHGITLTPTGVFLLERATVMLREADELEVQASSGGTELSGPLVVGSYFSLAPTVLPRLLRAFEENHPKVSVDFFEGAQDDVQQQLFAGRLDLAIVYDIQLPPRLSSVDVGTAPSYCLLPEKHRLAGNGAVSLEELSSEPLILVDAPPFVNHVLSMFAREGLEPVVRYRAMGFELVRSLVGQGMGYAIVSQRPAGNASYEGLPVVARPITPESAPVAIKMIWPSTMVLTDRASAMVELARGGGGE